jgi:hypothetical protein
LAANTFLTSSVITREALRLLENKLSFTSNVNKEYSDKFGVDGAKIGDTVNVRKPPKYLGRRGQAAQVEAVKESSVPVKLTTQYGVDLEMSTADLTLSIDDFSKRILAPGISRIANMIDQDGLALYNQVYNAVGTPGTTPNALMTYLMAGVALDNSAAPEEERSIVFTPLMQATIVDALKGLMQKDSEIARQYARGRMGQAIGFGWNMDQNCATHTVGPLGGVPLINGANQVGNALVTDGWTAAAALRLKLGDVFTIQNVFSVNPQSLQSTGMLQQFVVQADTNSDGAGNATISISPSIIVGTAFATVNAAPADNAPITVLGAANTASPVGLAYQRDAFTFATADLYIPKGVDMSGRMSDKQLGLSVRFIRQYDAKTDQLISRLDLLGGWTVIRPELAARIHA